MIVHLSSGTKRHAWRCAAKSTKLCALQEEVKAINQRSVSCQGMMDFPRMVREETRPHAKENPKALYRYASGTLFVVFAMGRDMSSVSMSDASCCMESPAATRVWCIVMATEETLVNGRKNAGLTVNRQIPQTYRKNCISCLHCVVMVVPYLFFIVLYTREYNGELSFLSD
ncbi:unnamed protein product [Darwinula stevensoni]|uniref:Uncharacterized protein n=1 Tax=Darwinula stevensoni TaxID=69355 RepID=A0A7R8XBP1_9CRUS|nr:unnamed protein product [Darwinula stevensoni]CAG0891209.1 unnamed protein product [Darwinula stevensoni]